MRTNLLDSEKESLLKFFLLHGTMETIDQKYIWKFDSDYVFLPFEEGLVKTIIKAQDNLRNTMFFNDNLKDVQYDVLGKHKFFYAYYDNTEK